MVFPLPYLAGVLHTPDNVIKVVKQCIVSLIWDGGSSKIAHDVIIQQIQDGRLNRIHFAKLDKSFKIHMAQKINRWNSTMMKCCTTFSL